MWHENAFSGKRIKYFPEWHTAANCRYVIKSDKNNHHDIVKAFHVLLTFCSYIVDVAVIKQLCRAAWA